MLLVLIFELIFLEKYSIEIFRQSLNWQFYTWSWLLLVNTVFEFLNRLEFRWAEYATEFY